VLPTALVDETLLSILGIPGSSRAKVKYSMGDQALEDSTRSFVDNGVEDGATITVKISTERRDLSGGVKGVDVGGWMRSISELFDGRIVTTSEEAVFGAKVWDSALKSHFRLTTTSSYISCARVLADGQLAIGTQGGEVSIFDIASATGPTQPLVSFKNHENLVSDIAETADGKLLTASWDESVCVVDRTGSVIRRMQRHKAGVCAVVVLQWSCFSGDVVAASSDNTLSMWNGDTYEFHGLLEGHTNYVICAIELFDGRICSGSADRSVRIWDLESCSRQICAPLSSLLFLRVRCAKIRSRKKLAQARCRRASRTSGR